LLSKFFSTDNSEKELRHKIEEVQQSFSAKSSDQNLFVIHNNIETKMTVEEIFDNNFTDLKIVTYKISPSFFNDVVKNFQTVMLIIGDKKINAEIFQDKSIKIKITKSKLIHDKIFLLANEDRKNYRVVTGSANFTNAALNVASKEHNFESIRIDDSKSLYDLYLQRFNFLYNDDQSKEYNPKSPIVERTFSDFLKQLQNSNFEKNYFERNFGFEFLDNKQKIYPGLYILGGAPAAGKTTFILQILKQLAEQGEHCIFYSYETSEQDLHFKTVAQESFQQYQDTQDNFPITVNQLQKNFKTDKQVQKLFDSFKDKNWDLRILKLTTENIDDLLERLQKICDDLKSQDKSQYKPPIVAIDYLQIIPSKFSNDKDGVRFAIDDILKKIKQFQLETNTRFFLISSFGKGKVNDSHITFGSFKESSGIEYTADVVWGLNWKDKEQEKLADEKIKIVKKFFEVDFHNDIPAAKYDYSFTEEEFNIVNNIAKKIYGHYFRDDASRMFLFEGNGGEKNRDAFVAEVENISALTTKKVAMRQIELVCLKNRQGKIYTADFKFYPEFAYFKSEKDEQKNSDNEI